MFRSRDTGVLGGVWYHDDTIDVRNTPEPSYPRYFTTIDPTACYWVYKSAEDRGKYIQPHQCCPSAFTLAGLMRQRDVKEITAEEALALVPPKPT